MFENIVRVSTVAHAKRGFGKWKYAVYQPWLRPNAVGSGKTRTAAQAKKSYPISQGKVYFEREHQRIFIWLETAPESVLLSSATH